MTDNHDKINMNTGFWSLTGGDWYRNKKDLERPSPNNPSVENDITYVYWICAALTILFFVLCIYIWYQSKNKDEEDGHDEEMGVSAAAVDENIHRGIFEKLASMSKKDRIEWYDEAFNRNQHQVVLEDSQIMLSSDDDDEETSKYLDLEDARQNHPCLFMNRSSSQSSSCTDNDDVVATESIKLDDVASSKELAVHGHCIICFEDLCAGDTIVWSESRSCPHVYHKECMINFLAHNVARTVNTPASIKLDDLERNPCPTCRQPFFRDICAVDNTTPTVCSIIADASRSDSSSSSIQSIDPTESSSMTGSATSE